jgi:hypothetical protein
MELMKLALNPRSIAPELCYNSARCANHPMLPGGLRKFLEVHMSTHPKHSANAGVNAPARLP